MILTIGHSNLALNEFLGLLKQHGIQTLVDVRSKPYSSYSPHFSKRELSSSLKDAGIEYQFEGRALGGLGEINCADPEFIEAMERVLALQSEGNVALMCAEKNPRDCHRGFKLLAWLHTQPHLGEVNTAHITPTGVLDGRQFESQQKPGWSELESRTEQLELGLT